MSDMDELTARLQTYGGQLKVEVAAWPAFVPVEPSGLGVPLLILRRRLGRWSRPGRRPSFALLIGAVLAVAVAVAVTIALIGTNRGGESGDVSVPTDAANAGPVVEAAPSSQEPRPSASTAPLPTDTEPTDTEPTDTEPSDTEPGDTEPTVDTETAVAPNAALSASPACVDGELVGAACKIVSAPFTLASESECLARGGSVGEDADCFRVVDATATCPVGAPSGTDQCVLVVGTPTSAQTRCAVGELRADQMCVVEVPGTMDCGQGQFRDGRCVVQGPAPDGGDLVCSVGDPNRSADQCVAFSAADCGGLVAVASGCRQDGTTRQVFGCSGSEVLTGQRCEPADGCKHSYSKSIGPCGSPAVAKTVCSLTGAPVSTSSDCFVIVAGSCPTGTPSGGGCIEQRPMATSAASCPAEWTLIGLQCVRFDEPAVQCQTGAPSTSGTCTIESPAQIVEAGCPAGTSQQRGTCVQVTDISWSCSEGQLTGSTCRVPVPLDLAPRCDPGSIRVFDTCVRYEATAAS